MKGLQIYVLEIYVRIALKIYAEILAFQCLQVNANIYSLTLQFMTLKNVTWALSLSVCIYIYKQHFLFNKNTLYIWRIFSSDYFSVKIRDRAKMGAFMRLQN